MGVFNCSPPYFLRRDLTLTCGLLVQLGWLLSKSSCLCFPSAGVTGKCSHAWLLCESWGSELGSLHLCSKHLPMMEFPHARILFWLEDICN